MMKSRVVPFLITVFASLSVGLSPQVASADAACEFRSAKHVAEHGGLAADSAWHVANGELPTCDPDSKQRAKRSDGDGGKDKKSRFCRKRWWC
jgi:hypothetical protein